MKPSAKWTGGVENVLGLENELFRKRMAVLSGFISSDDKSFIDFGAGAEYLRKILDDGAVYYPVDYVRRSDRTILCDLNKGEFPDVHADVAFMAGFLGYMEDVDGVIEKASRAVRKIIVSYKGSEKFEHSPLSTDEVIAIFNKHGFALTQKSEAYPDDWTLLACFEKLDVRLISKNPYCTGCSACSNICPVRSISMQYDGEGFLKPSVNFDTCINCGKCAKVCPTLNHFETRNDEHLSYAAWAKDEYRLNSSSGGVFSELAHQTLLQGGVVFGAAWAEGFFLEHVYIEDENDLHKLRYSKYVQSNVEKSFLQAKAFLESDRKVLYAGTPCQIAGLKSYLGKLAESGNLITVDFLCFCSPSNILFQKYLAETFGLENVKNVTFRHKHNGWSAIGYKIELKNGEVVYPTLKGMENDLFQRLFHSTAARNNVCENCQFADFPRQADFSIGDFWCVEQSDPSWDDRNGTSLVIVNSQKAKIFFEEKVMPNLKRVQQVTDGWYRNKGNRIGNGGRKGTKYHRFLTLQKTHSFSAAVEQVTQDKHDIGLVCMLGPNYGNQLTYYAMYNVLCGMNFSTILINFPEDCNMERNMAAEHKDKFALWQKKPYPDYDVSVHSPHKGALMQYNWNCDMFVLGSDQLLRAGFVWDMGFHQCLDWVYSGKYKIAYATSFGSGSFEGDDRLRAREGFFLKRFQKISVREVSGIDILKSDFGIDDAVHVLDPVFLCETAAYEKMARLGSMRLPDGKFTAAYILDPTESRAEMVWHIAKTFTNENAVAVSDAGRAKDDGYKWSFPTLEKVKVEEWLAIIKNCDFFLTDSFHGVCFALIFGKQFAVTFDKAQWRGLERIVSVLEMFGLQDRLVSNLQDVKDRKFEANRIDYEKIASSLTKKRSSAWLDSRMPLPKEKHTK